MICGVSWTRALGILPSPGCSLRHLCNYWGHLHEFFSLFHNFDIPLFHFALVFTQVWKGATVSIYPEGTSMNKWGWGMWEECTMLYLWSSEGKSNDLRYIQRVIEILISFIFKRIFFNCQHGGGACSISPRKIASLIFIKSLSEKYGCVIFQEAVLWCGGKIKYRLCCCH